LATVATAWPRESFHGFFAHFAQMQNGALVNLGEHSTVDSAELIMGALFAGRYFGGEVDSAAWSLARNVSWSDALEGAESPRVFPVVDPSSGELSGTILPYNEYYIVAYLAQLMDPAADSKATRFFDTYHGYSAAPAGRNGHPVKVTYNGHELLTDQPSNFMSSFIPQFCWFQTKGFQSNGYYAQSLFPAWLQADMDYWEVLLSQEDVKINGQSLREGKPFGCGAGPGTAGYVVNRINGTEEPHFSAAIMAGFLPVADAAQRQDINTRLAWLLDRDVCIYTKGLPSGARVRVPWRCSIRTPEWRAESADSIDFSTFVLGYAMNFLPDDFYAANVA